MGGATQLRGMFLPARRSRCCFHILRQAAGSREGGRLSPFLIEIGENPANPRQKVRTCPIFPQWPAAALTFPANYDRIAYKHWFTPCGMGQKNLLKELCVMERIKTLETRDMCESAKNGGCGECQTSCQSACKTSCGVANQKCENTEK